MSPSGHTRRIIGRAQQIRALVEESEDVPFVPDMISGSQYVDAKIKQLPGYVWGKSESGSRVFRVGDDQIDLVSPHQAGQKSPQHLSSGLADDVTDKKYFQDYGPSETGLKPKAASGRQR